MSKIWQFQTFSTDDKEFERLFVLLWKNIIGLSGANIKQIPTYNLSW